MANNYSQFSEVIEDITPEEAVWIRMVLDLDVGKEVEAEKLKKEIGLEEADLDSWPAFNCDLEEKDTRLWLYSDEGFIEDQLVLFIQAFIRKFCPDFIFSATGANTCSKLRVGEFGG